MRRELLLALHKYFETIGEKRSETEENLFRQLTGELPYFPISSLHRDDLENEGFDVSGVTDGQMKTVANKMGDDYCEQLYWGSLRIIAGDCVGIPKKEAETETERYVRVEFPEDASYFEENDIGYPCFNSEDNGARYVPEAAYLEYFGHEPQPNSYFQAICWPESQKFMDMENEAIAALCEPVIADEKALNDFGSSAIWTPLCLID